MALKLIIKSMNNRTGQALMRVDWRGMERNKYAPWGRNAY
jgi:hypothetical protein